MGYITKSYLMTQFTNFSTRIATVFAKKTEIPSKTSQLNNDSNFVEDANYVHTDKNYSTDDKAKVDSALLYSVQTLTEEQKAQARANIGAGASGFDGDYNSLTNKPTKLSEFTNDENFITNSVDNLTNYYTKSNSYTKEEINTLIDNTKNGRFVVVSALPTTDIQTNVIYLVPASKSTAKNVKDEYINIDGTTSGWELIGSTAVDLSDYLKSTDAESTYVKITDSESGNIDFSNYFA